MKQHYIRHSDKKYLISDILDNMHNDTHIFDGETVAMQSHRYHCFKERGTTCIACGIEGTHFRLERAGNAKRYHFNLYTDSGRMMTKDHIVPKSKGGANHIDNYQTMCYKCNNRKGTQNNDIFIQQIKETNVSK